MPTVASNASMAAESEMSAFAAGKLERRVSCVEAQEAPAAERRAAFRETRRLSLNFWPTGHWQNHVDGPSSLRRKSSFAGHRGSFQRSMSSMSTKVAHYAALVIAEDPIAQHKEYLESLEEEDSDAQLEEVHFDSAASTSQRGLLSSHKLTAEQSSKAEVRSRWRSAANSILSSAKLVVNSQIMNDKHAGGAERFVAVVELEQALHDNPHKKMLMRTLQLKENSSTDRVLDLFVNEVLLTGERIFDFFTPAEIGQHTVVFTYAMIFVCFAVFYYMIGAYPLYELQRDPSVAPCMAALDSHSGRQLFVDWMFPKGAEWCFKDSKWVMNSAYLRLWGARFGPLMKAQPSRWFSSWLVHQSFTHVTSNMALLLVVAYQIEEKYGFWRITLLYFISALGGSFFGAAFENGCKTVLGASGGVFGMMGLFIADLILNFETVKRPLLRGLLMVAFLVYFVVSAATSTGSSSIWSHVGGFLCGLFPSFLFLPNLRSEKWEQILPILGVFVMLGVFVGLPVYFYRHIFPVLQCTAL